MNLKRQTAIPAHAVRRVDRVHRPAAEPPRREQPRAARPAPLPVAVGLECPGCNSRTEIAPATSGDYPLVCYGCGATGTLEDFGGLTAHSRGGAFRPAARSRFEGPTGEQDYARRLQSAVEGLFRRRKATE